MLSFKELPLCLYRFMAIFHVKAGKLVFVSGCVGRNEQVYTFWFADVKASTVVLLNNTLLVVLACVS